MAAAPAQARTTLRIERTFAASRERVFEAWTDPELLARWLTPPGGTSANADVDLRVGGAWSITMKPPLWPSGRGFGTYLEGKPPARLVFTIAWERIPNGPQSLVSVDFDDLDGARPRSRYSRSGSRPDVGAGLTRGGGVIVLSACGSWSRTARKVAGTTTSGHWRRRWPRSG